MGARFLGYEYTDDYTGLVIAAGTVFYLLNGGPQSMVSVDYQNVQRDARKLMTKSADNEFPVDNVQITRMTA